MIRKNLLIWTTIITSIIFIFRLGYLQLSNDFYKSASNNNAIQELAVYPERGLMFDRNGNLLVSNQPMYDLELIPENLSEFDTLELSEILGISKNNLINKIKDAYSYSRKIPAIIKIDNKTNLISILPIELPMFRCRLYLSCIVKKYI